MDTLLVRLDWAPSSAAAAREAVSCWLGGVECDDDAKHDIVLAASELVTRAVNACVGGPMLAVRPGVGRVRLEVDSAEAIVPSDLPGNSSDIGTLILQSICLDHGVATSPTSTKMWAELAY